MFHHIQDKKFDLMEMQGGIQRFAERYGLDKKIAYRLQLCTEELVNDLLAVKTSPLSKIWALD